MKVDISPPVKWLITVELRHRQHIDVIPVFMRQSMFGSTRAYIYCGEGSNLGWFQQCPELITINS